MGWAPWHDWQFACTIVLISQGSEPSSFDCAGSPVEPDPPPGLHPAIATTANDRILSFRIWYSPNNNLQCRECNVHVGTERATSTFWINIFASGVTRAFSLDFLRDDIKPGQKPRCAARFDALETPKIPQRRTVTKFRTRRERWSDHKSAESVGGSRISLLRAPNDLQCAHRVRRVCARPAVANESARFLRTPAARSPGGAIRAGRTPRWSSIRPPNESSGSPRTHRGLGATQAPARVEHPVA